MAQDDLSSALDVETEEALWERLAGRTECTVLAVSHRRAALARVDTIVVLESGRVRAAGTPSELLVTSAYVRSLFESRESTPP